VPRLARRSAGSQVAARASALADDLLVLENDCFAAIDGCFADATAAVDRSLTQAWSRAKDDPVAFARDADLITTLLAGHATVLHGTRPHVAAMAGQARDLALEAIGDELLVCEQTLAQRYLGLAVEAVTAATDRSDDLVSDRLADYADALARGQVAFEEQIRQQVLIVGARGETLEHARRRVLSEKALSLPGNGGRGVWWRATSGLHAAAREVSIRLSGTVRLAAMQEFNAAGERR
jgi:hypothetical protein